MTWIDDEKKLKPFFDTHLVDELTAADEEDEFREERKRRYGDDQ